MRPVANLIPVENVELALEWYKKAFPTAVERVIDGFTFLQVAGFALELVQADEKVGPGKLGSVTYWQVDDLDSEIARFQTLGST